MLRHILQGLFSFWLFGSFLHALGCMGKRRQLYEALMKNYQMTEKDRDFTGGVNMEKIIRALHLRMRMAILSLRTEFCGIFLWI